jgi:hypothetical protein
MVVVVVVGAEDKCDKVGRVGFGSIPWLDCAHYLSWRDKLIPI